MKEELPRRQKTQRRDAWPFLYSVTERGLVKNVAPEPAQPAKRPRPILHIEDAPARAGKWPFKQRRRRKSSP